MARPDLDRVPLPPRRLPQLGELPAWVRTRRRVRLWVHAKLMISAVRIAALRMAA